LRFIGHCLSVETVTQVRSEHKLSTKNRQEYSIPLSTQVRTQRIASAYRYIILV
jgi:hypothetical protein